VTKTNLNMWLARAVNLFCGLTRRQRMAVALGMAFALLAGVALIGGWLSRPLTAREALALRTFAIRTNSKPVIDRYNEAVRNGPPTQRDAEAVVEIAKSQGPGYGLISAIPDYN